MRTYDLIGIVIKCTHYQGNEKQKYKKYRQILAMWYKHQQKMIPIITNLHKYASFKSYFYLMTITGNRYLENIIFGTLMNILKDDIQKYKQGKEISNLAKWMPKEGSFFDRKLNFVNRFVRKFYKIKTERDIQHLDSFKKIYRETLVMLKEKLDLIECALCQQKANINFNNMSNKSINKYFNHFFNDDAQRDKFINFMKCRYIGMETEILKHVWDENVIHDKDKEIINEIWNLVKFKYFNQVENKIKNKKNYNDDNININDDLDNFLLYSVYNEYKNGNQINNIIEFMENMKFRSI
jgi:hypothetical protein